MRVFFACGAPKSGTTWLQLLLDAHPQVACSGEGHFIERFSSPFAQVVKSYNQQMALVAERVYQGKPYYQPITQSEFDAFVRQFIIERLKQRVDVQTVQWIGDKTPRYATQLTALSRLFPDAPIINIVRDPRDVAVSRLHHANRAGVAGALDPSSAAHADLIHNAATAWVANVAPVLEFARANPKRAHQLRYEDLLSRPADEAWRLFNFLQVADDETSVSLAVERTSFESLSGRKPGHEDSSSFFRKGVAGDWQASLERRSLKIIEEHCGALMRQLHYR